MSAMRYRSIQAAPARGVRLGRHSVWEITGWNVMSVSSPMYVLSNIEEVNKIYLPFHKVNPDPAYGNIVHRYYCRMVTSSASPRSPEPQA